MTKRTRDGGYEFSEPALRDVEEILRYLSDHDVRAAEKFVRNLERCCTILACHGEIGRLRDDVRPGLRSFVFAPRYCIYYDLVDTDLRVSRILHTARLLDEQNS